MKSMIADCRSDSLEETNVRLHRPISLKQSEKQNGKQKSQFSLHLSYCCLGKTQSSFLWKVIWQNMFRNAHLGNNLPCVWNLWKGTSKAIHIKPWLSSSVFLHKVRKERESEKATCSSGKKWHTVWILPLQKTWVCSWLLSQQNCNET